MRTALNKPVTLMAPLTKEPASGYPSGLLAISSFRLSIRGPSFYIGLFALSPSRSAEEPALIPPLNKDPANEPKAAAPVPAREPIAEPIP